jgi:hypothetical protein
MRFFMRAILPSGSAPGKDGGGVSAAWRVQRRLSFPDTASVAPWARRSILLNLLLLAALSGGLRAAHAEVPALELAPGWAQGTASGANVWSAIHPGDAEDGSRDSHLTLQVHPMDSKGMQDFRAKVLAGEWKDGQKVGSYTATEVRIFDQCLGMLLQAKDKPAVRQTWCFGDQAAAVLLEKGPETLGSGMRMQFERVLSRMSRAEEPGR